MWFSGVWPALVSPLTEAGEIDCKAAESLVGALLQTGIGGLYIGGSTGEGVLLTRPQRKALAECVVGIVGGRVPVMAHVGALSTRETVALARDAAAAGVNAVSAVPPFFFSYDFAAIRAHYAALAAAADVPLYLYYYPSATGSAIQAEELLEICEMDGVAGFKYTSSDMMFFSKALALRDPSKVNVLSGPDPLFMICQALGADGAIGTTYNIAPRLFVDIYQALKRSKISEARELQYAANRVIALLVKHGTVPAIKASVGLLGYPVGQGVPPMPRIEGARLAVLSREMREAGLFDLQARASLYGVAGDPMRGKLA